MSEPVEPSPASPFVTQEQAAAYLTVSPSWLEASDCPRCKLGRRVVYHLPTLERWALAHATHEVAA
jgi:hypothetical protein